MENFHTRVTNLPKIKFKMSKLALEVEHLELLISLCTAHVMVVQYFRTQILE